MPVIRLRQRVPSPVRLLSVNENDAGLREFLVRVAPHVVVAEMRAGLGPTRPLEPRVLIRGVVDDKLGDDPQVATMRLADEGLEVRHPPKRRVDVLVIGDVIAVVAQRRRIERQQPQRRHPQILQIIELAAQPLEIADPVVIGVEEGLDVQLIDDRVLVPKRVGGRRAQQRVATGQRRGSVVWRRHAA